LEDRARGVALPTEQLEQMGEQQEQSPGSIFRLTLSFFLKKARNCTIRQVASFVS
jgi:hypothetical protein